MDDHDFTRTCKVCGREFDIETEGSDEEEDLCISCEEHFFCISCGVELCKPSECPQGVEFKCHCGVVHRRRGDKMVISGGPEDTGPLESYELSDLIEGERRITYVLADIHAERNFQNQKWGRKPGEWNKSPFVKLGVLAEEFGEVARALLERSPVPELKKELVQVAAVAAAWAEDCDSGLEEHLHQEGTELEFQRLQTVNPDTPIGSVVVLIDHGGSAHLTYVRSLREQDGQLFVITSAFEDLHGVPAAYPADQCHVISRQGDPKG